VERDGFYSADLVPDPAMVDAKEAANNALQWTGFAGR
jgi:hypothetical protein